MTDRRASQKAWYEANKDRVNAESRARYRRKREEVLKRQAAYRAANPEVIAAQRKAHYEANAEAIKERNRKRYAEQREAKLEALQAYRSRPEWPAEQAARRKAWKEANRGRVVEYEAMRRARSRGVDAELVQRAVLWERDAGICHLCGTSADPADWHIEHIIPLSRGGDHTYANTAVSHPECNLLKQDADPREPDSPYAFLLLRVS